MSDLGSSAALIDRLASDLRPIRPGIMPRRLLMAVGICASPSLAAVVWLWGVRPDIAAALQTPAFWAKEAFAATLAVAGSAAMLRLARPDGKAAGPIYIAFGAVAVMVALAVLQLGATPPAALAPSGSGQDCCGLPMADPATCASDLCWSYGNGAQHGADPSCRGRSRNRSRGRRTLGVGLLVGL
jgi:hypothetical protein